ncbi:unnamed protein product [Tilletia controversa]|nr:unnamed protein product [Tilletia controversa]
MKQATMTQSFDRKRKLFSAAAGNVPQDRSQQEGVGKRHKLVPAVPNTAENAETTKASPLKPIDGEIARLITVNAKGARHIIRLQDGEVFTVGRSPDCDYILNSLRASRKHVKFLAVRSDVTGQPHVICEDSSRFGVFVNDLKVDRRFILSHGDEIKAAGQSFKLNLVEESSFQMQELAEEIPTSFQVPPSKRICKYIGSIAVTDKVLGAGTYASVYLGFDTRGEVHKQVAVKAQLKRTYVPGTHAGVYTELELIKTLRHPNINRILASHEDGTHIFMVLELHQIDLFGYIQNWGAVQVPTAKFIFFQLLHAVQHLHEKGVSHRDIKPENIYIESAVSSFPRICLGDFGLAYRPPEYSQGGKATGISSRTYSFCGTLGYLPPEVFKQHLDMWSCGVTLFFALSATHPFDNDAKIPDWKIIPNVIEEEMIADGELPSRDVSERSGDRAQDNDVLNTLFDTTPQKSMLSLAQELIQLGVDPGMGMPEPFNAILEAQTQGQEQQEDESDIDGEPIAEGTGRQKSWHMEREYLRNIMHGHLPGIPWLLTKDAAGQSIIAGLINVSSEERLTAAAALNHEWFTSAQPGLSTMYQHRVLSQTSEQRS